MLECRVPAAASELRRVRRRADDAAAEFGLAASDRYEFVFAVNEAVTNAIKHGRPDRDGTIGLQIVADGDTLICSISDSGQFQLGPHGPDPDGPDRDGPDPLGESGRGLACISRLMDRIELSTAPHGTTLRLHKRRRGNHAEHAA